MKDPSPVDKWLGRINIIATLVISLTALFVAARQSEDKIQDLTTAVNGRMDTLNQSFGEIKQSYLVVFIVVSNLLNK